MDAAHPSVVAVVGSPRRNGNTAVLVAAALEDLEHRGAACETIDLGRLSLAPCLAHGTCGELAACVLDDDAAESLERVYAADCLILGTPVYYENVTAQMKAFMDRNVYRYNRDEWLSARAVGLLAVTGETGLDDAIAAMRRYVALSTTREVPTVSAGVIADGLGVVAGQPESLAAARELGAGVAELLAGAT